mmetsp:Transcript_26497/g.37207  ORF Transcript_26497/g.37207 Transcript_26497/m.37207 type:complete len:528 (+) Transcript_26497:672-2255(+)
MEVPTNTEGHIEAYSELLSERSDLFEHPSKPPKGESFGIAHTIVKQYYDSKEHKEFIYLLCFLDFDPEDIEWFIKKALLVSMRLLQYGLSALEPIITAEGSKKSRGRSHNSATKSVFLVNIAKFLISKGRFIFQAHELPVVETYIRGHKGTGINLKIDSIKTFSGSDSDWIEWKQDTMSVLKACGLMTVCTDKGTAKAFPEKDVAIGAMIAKSVSNSPAYCFAQTIKPGSSGTTSVAKDVSASVIWSALIKHYESDDKKRLMSKRYKYLLEACKYDARIHKDPQDFIFSFLKLTNVLRGWEEGLEPQQRTPDSWYYNTFVDNMASKNTTNFSITREKLVHAGEDSKTLAYACDQMISAHIRDLMAIPAREFKFDWKKLRPHSINHVQEVGNKERTAASTMKSKSQEKAKVPQLPRDVWSKLSPADKRAFRKTGDKTKLPKDIQMELQAEPTASSNGSSEMSQGDASPEHHRKRPASHQGEEEKSYKAKKVKKRNKKVKFPKGTKANQVAIQDPSTEEDYLDTQYSAL